MTVLVLSVLPNLLEDELVRQAHTAGTPMPIVCMSAQAAAYRRTLRAPLRPHTSLVIESLHDFTHLRRLAARVEGSVDTIATVDECGIQAAAFLRAHLGLPGMELPTAVACTDKHIQKAILAAAGIPVAASALGYRPEDVIDAAADLDGWPLVIKPRLGVHGHHTRIVNDVAHLYRLRTTGVFTKPTDIHPALAGEPAHRGLAASTTGFLIEEYLPIRAEYHCEILRLGGTTVYAIVGQSARPRLDEYTDGYAAGVLLDPASADAVRVRTLALAAADALGLPDGAAHAQIFHTQDGEWILNQIAARPGDLGIPTTIAHAYTGIRLPHILAALARGEEPAVHADLNHGTFGWAAALSRPALLERIANLDHLRTDPRILDAEILQEPGTVGQPGGIPAAIAYLHTHTAADMRQAVHDTAGMFDIAWSPRARVPA
jgi:hypothetical protein